MVSEGVFAFYMYFALAWLIVAMVSLSLATVRDLLRLRKEDE